MTAKKAKCAKKRVRMPDAIKITPFTHEVSLQAFPAAKAGPKQKRDMVILNFRGISTGLQEVSGSQARKIADFFTRFAAWTEAKGN